MVFVARLGWFAENGLRTYVLRASFEASYGMGELCRKQDHRHGLNQS